MDIVKVTANNADQWDYTCDPCKLYRQIDFIVLFGFVKLSILVVILYKICILNLSIFCNQKQFSTHIELHM